METEPPKADPPKRKRRWFQFSLRALMIVVTLLAVPCAYVGWQAKIVRQRKAMVRRIVDVGGRILTRNPYDNRPNPVPWIRRFLGDEPVSVVLLPIATSPTTRGEVHVVFPEAAIRAKKDADPMTQERKVIDFPAETEGK